MTRNLIVFLILTALIGLMFVQFQLLVVGVRLEKKKLDQKVEAAVNDAKLYFEKDTLTNDLLYQLLRMDKGANTIIRDSLYEVFQQRLATKIGQALRWREVFATFSFVLSDRYYVDSIRVVSSNFDAQQFRFDEYFAPIGDYLLSKCHRCRLTLHLHIHDVFSYLLQALNYILLPSLACVLAIIVGVLILLRILKKEKQLNLIKNDFINNLTHELKTPVFSISLSSKILEERLKNKQLEDAQTFLQLIQKENKKLKHQIDKVLELATLENTSYQLQKGLCDVHVLIQEVTESFEVQVAARGGVFRQNLQATQTNFLADSTHFKNILQNLLDNALKYSIELIDIELTTWNEGNRLFIGINDQGIGITTAYQSQIFDKFFRVPTGNIHQVKGFGLGLHYVKNMVEAHGGRISVKSKKGIGSQFLIDFEFVICKK